VVPVNTWASSEGKMKVIRLLSSLINRLAGIGIHQRQPAYREALLGPNTNMGSRLLASLF
jgi:hypothetical protein